MAKDIPFAFNASQESLKAQIEAAMIAKYEAEKGAGSVDFILRSMIRRNAEKVATITHQELQTAKKSLTAEDTPQAVAERVAKNVGVKLEQAYASASADDPLRLAVDGLKLGGAVAQPGMGRQYFSRVSEDLKTELTKNFSTHTEAFAALKPKPKEAAPAVAEAPKEPENDKSWIPSLIPSAAAAQPPPAATPPASPPAPPAEKATGEPRSLLPETKVEPAAPAPAAAPPAPSATPAPAPAAAAPSLTDLFSLAARGAESRESLIPLLQNMLNDDDPEVVKKLNDKIKDYIRGGITSAEQNLQNYPEKDIEGFANQIRLASREWLNKHQSEIIRGNLSSERIRALSNELAMGVRVRMTPEKVGAFATSEYFVIHKPDIITGVDAQGNATRPFSMNIQSLAETILAGAAADEVSKKRYKEQLAYEESHRAFYASEEAAKGVTPEMATSVARARMKGRYSEHTQAAVEQMTSQHFRPSNMFSRIWDYITAIFGALMSGKIGELLVSFQDGSFSAHRREKEAADKNFDLHWSILSSGPEALGYEGSPDNFMQWKHELATQVTGIHFDESRRTITDIDRSTGATTGIAAVAQGLNPDGTSRVEGMEGVMGSRIHYHTERQLRSDQRREQGRQRGEFDGGSIPTTAAGREGGRGLQPREFDGDLPSPSTPPVVGRASAPNRGAGAVAP